MSHYYLTYLLAVAYNILAVPTRREEKANAKLEGKVERNRVTVGSFFLLLLSGWFASVLYLSIRQCFLVHDVIIYKRRCEAAAA